MAKVNKHTRWPISLAIITVVIVVSIVLALTHRVPSGKLSLRAVSDGPGGAILAWQDGQSIYAQRIDSNGKPLWTHDGVLVCSEPTLPEDFALTGDGLGGAIITWDDRANLSDDREDPAFFAPIPVYSQRINADGESLWGNGTPTGTNQRYGEHLPQVVPDGAGGAIVAWNDFQPVYRALCDDYLRLQKIDPEGNPMWGEKEVLVVSSSPFRPVTPEERERGEKGTFTRSRPTYRGCHKVVSDGSGGTIVIWEEEQAGGTHVCYAQRFDDGGQPVWKEGGIPISTISGEAKITLVVSDGFGGAILVLDSNGSHSAQRVNAGGKLLWSEGGVNLWRVGPQIASDGLGGAILSMEERRHPLRTDPRVTGQSILYAERLDGEGHLLWPEEPLFITEEGQWLQSVFASDGSGGAVIAWRIGEHTSDWKGKVFAQKLDAEGKLLWGEKGVMVFTSPDLEYQGSPELVSDGSGGAIVLAVVGEKPLHGDMVYAQRLDAAGNTLWGDGVKVFP